MTTERPNPTSPDPAAIGDHLALVQLTHDYCWALDTHEWDALRDVFTPDATARLGSSLTGIDAIIGRVSSALGSLDDSQHLVATHQLRIDGDTATGRCYLHAQHVRHAADGGPLYVVAGRYVDRFVRTERGWRIADRELVVMWTDGNVRVVHP